MLSQIISNRIRAEGPISFRTFMEMALYYPDYGYYTSPATEIGCKGDFYTSSHVHPVFGALIGKQIEEMWRLMDMPAEFHIIEFGGGRGYLAGDMLGYLRGAPFYNTIQYTIIEINPYLQEKQKTMLEPFMDRLQWTHSFESIRGVKGCIIANELLDAFPVHLVSLDSGIAQEVYVILTGDNFAEILCACDDGIANYFSEFVSKVPDNYRTEVNLAAKEWLQNAEKALDEGFLFIIDYGYPAQDYYSPARNKGTLVCYYQHQVNENPYQNIGMQDITAHVNFSAIKRWGEECGFRTIGFCPQGIFLVALRIDQVMQERFGEDSYYPGGHGRVSNLISPQGLGETHKVIIQYKGVRQPCITGFSLRNRLDAL